MTTLIRSASLTNFVEIAKQCGLQPLALLAEVGLPARCLNEPDLKIPAQAVGRLLELAAARAGEPAFGLRMAASRKLSNLGPLGLLLREEPTLKNALDRLVRYAHVHNEAIVIHLEHSSGLVVIREEIARKGYGSLRQPTELALGVTFRMISLFLGTLWRPKLVCFVHQAPRDTHLHRLVFGDAVEFGHEFNGIVCNEADLNAPNPGADPAIARMAFQLVDAKRGAAGDFRQKVAELVSFLLPMGLCNAKVLAQHLGCDRRTLARRLAANGAGFHQLVDMHRSNAVRHYLQENTRPLSEIAVLLGFSAPSAFSRWYRQRFGVSARVSLQTAAPDQ